MKTPLLAAFLLSRVAVAQPRLTICNQINSHEIHFEAVVKPDEEHQITYPVHYAR